MIETLANEPALNTAWFLVIGLFWTGYLVLDLSLIHISEPTRPN